MPRINWKAEAVKLALVTNPCPSCNAASCIAARKILKREGYERRVGDREWARSKRA